MKRRTKVLLIMAIVLLLIVISGLIGGCSSSVLAPKLAATEKIIVESTNFDFTVGVELFEPKIYSDRLIESLRRTNLFKDVNYMNTLSETPALVVKINRAVYGSAAIPIFTAITLGFFPTWIEEEHGNSFTVLWADGSNKSVTVNSVYKGYTVLGWISGLLNLFPDRTSGDSKTHPRYYERLAYDVISALN